MASLSLKRVLRKNRQLHSAVESLLQTLDGPLGVRDHSGALLLGQLPPDVAHSTPIELEGAVVGHVLGEPATAPAVAQLLASFLAHETEKRALAAEILDKYRELNLLYTLSERLLVEPNPQAIAHLALAEAGRAIDVTASWLLLVDGENTSVLSNTGGSLTVTAHTGDDENLLAHVLNSREAEIRNGVLASEYFVDSPFEECALLCAPLKTEQRVLGAMLLVGAPPINYAARDLKLLNTVALQVAPALEMARLYQVAVEQGRMERELQLAYQVQSGLIPSQAPEVSGWQLAGHWRPARELSGDYYDFIEEGEGRIGLVVGDVTDKGMPSALFMVHARAAVHTALRYCGTPSEAIFEASQLVHAESKQGHFVTLFYARLYTDSGILRYVNAGHNPPMLFGASERQLHELTRTGFPLGILPGAPYDEGQVQMDTGDVLVMYTDGLTEAVNDEGEDFGEARLQALIQEQAHSSATDLATCIAAALENFVGDLPPFDDLTLVVVKAGAQSEGTVHNRDNR